MLLKTIPSTLTLIPTLVLTPPHTDSTSILVLGLIMTLILTVTPTIHILTSRHGPRGNDLPALMRPCT